MKKLPKVSREDLKSKFPNFYSEVSAGLRRNIDAAESLLFEELGRQSHSQVGLLNRGKGDVEFSQMYFLEKMVELETECKSALKFIESYFEDEVN